MKIAPSKMRALTSDIIAASGEFFREGGLECGRPLNANGQTSSVTADVAGSPVNLATSITYLPFGPQTGMTYGSALTFSATYDQNYWPLSRAVSSLYSHAYTTDAAGNITGIDATD